MKLAFAYYFYLLTDVFLLLFDVILADGGREKWVTGKQCQNTSLLSPITTPTHSAMFACFYFKLFIKCAAGDK